MLMLSNTNASIQTKNDLSIDLSKIMELYPMFLKNQIIAIMNDIYLNKHIRPKTLEMTLFALKYDLCYIKINVTQILT